MTRTLLLIILLGVLGYAIYTWFIPSHTRRKSTSKPTLKKPPMELKLHEEATPSVKYAEYSWNEDPFAKLPITPPTSPQESQLQLRGILWDDRGGLAIINDDLVKVGDTIGGWRVVRITPSYVILKQGEIEIKLTPTE